MDLHREYFRKVACIPAFSGFLHGILFLLIFPVGLHGNEYRNGSDNPGYVNSVTPTITGPAEVCAGVSGYSYITEPGMTGYEWSVSAGGTVTAGMGTNAVTVTWNTAGNETVTVTYQSATGPAVLNVTVSPVAPAGISITPSANPVCAGTTVTFTTTTVNGGSSPVYQWTLNGIIVGGNSSSFSCAPSNGDVIGCQLTSNSPCASGNQATAVPVTMVVNANLPASVSISASGNPVCQGTQVTFLAVPSNGGPAPSYQWKVNGINTGTNSPGFTFLPLNGDVVTCQMTSNALCTTGNPANSNPVTISVSPSQPVSVTVTASVNPSCTGSPVIFNAAPVNGGSSPVFQWKVNGSVTGGNASILNYIPANGDLVNCELMSNASCAAGNPAVSNTVQMTVAQNLPVSVSVTPSSNPVCQGNSVVFMAQVVNGGGSPSYQWSINGFNVGTNSNSFSCIPASGDVVICQVNSTLSCTSGNPATSGPVTMNVMPVMPVNITIAGSANPVCVGTAVTFTATPYNGGSSPVYQWMVNGSNAGANSPVYSYIPGNGDVIACQLTSNASCTTGSTAMSNTVTMTVSANQPVGVSIAADAGTVCLGMTADLTATPTNGGSSPAYQWKVNGINAGTNNAYFSYIPSDGDIVTCQMTSSAICTTGNPAMSNAVTISVTQGQTLPVSVIIVPSTNPSCQGNQVTYTATPVNGGISPVFEWLVNGLNVGSNSPVFSYIPTNGDFVKCQLTSSYICATGNPAFSNEISMTVNPVLSTSVSIVASANPSCQGVPVNYTATAANPGTSPVYQWKVNGLNAGQNQSTFSYSPVSGDVVTCQLTSGVACPSTNPVTSNAITMSVQPVLPVSIVISTATNPSCQNTQVTFLASSTNGGTTPAYQWKLNGYNTGSNVPLLSFTALPGDAVTCQLTSNALCYSGSRTVLSNQVTMSVSNELPAGVSITSSVNPFCQGVPVTYSATPVNGGNTPSYQWKVNCVNVGTNSPTLNYTPANGDFITCQMTSSLICAVRNPAISNAITMRMNTGTPASVTINPSANPVCQASPVTFTAMPVNGGSLPVYQWKVNGVTSGSNSPTFSYTPSNGDAVTCRMTSNAACVSNSPATSAPVNMTVSTAMPAAISIATMTNPNCQGTQVNFTATATNGGSAPVYQWLVNNVNAGPPSGNASFACTPANGDIVTCSLTSNASCITGSNPVSSNQVVMSQASSLPAGISIAASANSICQGTAVTYTATAVNGGENPVFQWKVNGDNAGSNAPAYTYVPANGDVVTCQLTSSLVCAASNPATSNAVTMTVNPVLNVSVSIAASVNPCCAGTSVTFTATPTNGGTSPVYQWKVNCANVGTNSPTYTYTPLNGDVVVCVVTSNALCNAGSPATSNNINMVVLPMLPVSISISTLVNPFCVGTPVLFTAVPVNEGANPFYQWKVNGINAGTDTTVFVYQPVNGDIVTCELTSSSTCISGNPAMSNPITMIGNTGIPVSITIESNWTTTNNTVCQGTSVIFTATAVNGGPSPYYIWRVNGIQRGAHVNIYQYTPVNGDMITCQVISSLNCAVPDTAMSNTVTMNVNPSLPLAVSITASANPSCLGSTVTYTTSVTNGGTNPVYRWRVNGVNTGTPTTSPTFSYVPVNNDVVLCRVTSNATCATNNPLNSNGITMIVSPTTPATVTIAASANPVCQGTQVTYTATPFNGGTAPVYQWKVNGNNSGTNSVSFTYSPVNGDVVTCQMTSNSPCIAVTQVTSNPVSMTVSPIQPVGISITASTNPTCIASTVIFTASPVNGGTSPVYQWKVNGGVVGTNSPLYTYTPDNGDIVTCKLTSNAGCSTGNPANSNPVTMTVSESLVVAVSITASSNPSCQGQQVNYTANPVNGGINPVYQWQVNGIDVGTNSPVFSYAPTNGDFIKCRMTSGFSCATGNPATSNQINAVVDPFLPVSVSIASSSNPVCQGTAVTFMATAFNGGSAPFYQWRVNGLSTGSNLPVFTYTPLNGDVVDCSLTSNATCPLTNPVTSTPITMTVLEPVSAAIFITPSVNPVCPGTSVTYTSTVTNGGYSPQLQWMVNGIVVASNLASYTYVPANGDIVTCQLTSNANCVTNPTTMSNQVVTQVSSNLMVNVSIAASANPTCQGQVVSYTATGINGGANPVYQWMVNGLNIGENNPVFGFIPANGDVVICQMMSDLTCASGNPALSDPVSMEVDQFLPVAVSIVPASNPVCLNSPATFTATPVNGGASPENHWMVNGTVTGTNLPVFTYNPANGDTITCQIISGSECTAGDTALSNPVIIVVSTYLPVGITIAANSNPVCGGLPVTFACVISNGGYSPGYQWRVNGNNAGSGAASFSYTPADGDVVSCILTSDLPCATGNPAISNDVVMHVFSGQTATVSVVAEPAGMVCTGSPVTFTAIPVNGGVPSYQWYRNDLPVGTGQQTYTCIPDDGDMIYVVMTSGLSCVSGSPATSEVVTMTVSAPLQAGVTILPDLNNICQGTSVTFTATPENGGIPSYQWYVNNNPAGTGLPVFSYIPANGDQVYAVMTSGQWCVIGNPAISNTIDMVVIPAVPVSVSALPDLNNVCQGTSVTFTAIPVNGGTPAFQWYRNNSPVGQNQPSYSFIPEDNDLVYVVMTSNLACVNGSPAASQPVVMTVNPILPAGVSIIADQNNICEGTSVTFIATPSNGGMPAYQWYRNNLPVGLDQPAYTCVPADGDMVHVVMTSSQSCVSGNPATSGTVTMTVNPVLAASVAIVADQNNICQGTSVTFTATPSNGGTPSFQWFRNNLPVGLNQPSYTCYPAGGDQVYVVMTSSQTCISGNPATSNIVSMNVSPVLPVSVTVVPDQTSVCEGTPVTYTAIPTNGGIPAYQWYKNNIPTGTNQATYTDIPANGDMVYAVMTSGQSCVSGNPATSNTVSMVVSQVVPAGVSIVEDQNNICQGTSVTFTASPSNGGTPTYQWYRNNLPVGLDQPAYTCVPADGDMVHVVMTSSQSCVSGNPATSGTITMTVNPVLPASVAIVADQNNICQGISVTFTATPSNGGTPSYQWFRNNLPVGLNQPSYTCYPAGGDQVYVVMTSSQTCISGNPATSNIVSMNVSPVLPVSVTVVPDLTSVCEGTPITYTAIPANGGNPAYQWYKNNIPTGTNQATYTDIPANGDMVYAVMTSGQSCVSGNPATSNTVSMVVSQVVPADVSIVADQNNICQGTSVTFTATASNGGTPAYQWYRNNLPVGLDQPAYTCVPANGDMVHVIMTSSLSCVSGSPSTSNTIQMVVNTPLQAGVSIVASQNNICEGTPVTFTATPSNGGTPLYQWYRNNLPVGLNQDTYTCIPSTGDQVHVIMTSNQSCVTGSPATSNSITMDVNPILPAGVSIIPDLNNICEGTSVTFTATPVNGGVPAYQWFRNGSPAGLNQPVYTCIPVDGDQVYVVMTSSEMCISGNPATSGTVTMTVNPVVPASVSIAADQTEVCLGTVVTFTASPVNGGTPSFQWYVNNFPAGANQPVYSYYPVDGDQVHVVMISSMTCVSGSPSTSNTIQMIVNTPLQAEVTIVASQNDICEGTPVTFTATPANGGTPAYQWYRNNLPVGLNQPSYTCVPANGDQVFVLMTSSLSCISGNPSASNTIEMTVNPVLPVSVSITADVNDICEGTPVTFTAVAVNGGTPSFQWFLNGSPAGANQPTFTCVPSDDDEVYVVLTTSLACASGSPAASNTISVSVNPLLPVSVSITSDQNDICSGTPVTFTAVVNNGGDPGYQWYLNNVPAGFGQPAFTCVPSNGDQVFVVVNSSLQCVSGNPAASGTLVMVVNDPLPAGVSIIADQNSVCEGSTVTFTAIPSNGGTPSYQWYKDNLPVGGNLPVYSCVPLNGERVYVVMTSSLSCLTGNPATSQEVTMEVNPVVPVAVSIAASQNNGCQGVPVTLTAYASNGGSPSYQWYKNGFPAGDDEADLTIVPAGGDQVYVVLTSSLACVSANPATSNVVTLNVTQAAGIAGMISGTPDVCTNTQGAVYSVAPIADASDYHWNLPPGATIISGDHTTSITVGFGNDPGSGDISVYGSNSCGNGPASPSFHVTVTPIPETPVITLQWPMLQSSATEGNQWYHDGNLMADSTGPTCQATRPGWYWTVVTEQGCSSDSSNHVYVDETGPGTIEPGILVYPVPNDGHFTVSITLQLPETFNIDMYNYLGEHIYELHDLLVTGKYKEDIDLRPVAKGLYTIVFKSAGYNVVKKVLVVKK